MYQDYIQKSDITSRFNDVNLEELTGDNDNVWMDVEKTTLEWVAAHVRHWYDSDKEFRPVATHALADEYNEDARVSDSGYLYIAIQPVPTSIAITNTDYWIRKDDRNKVLVRIVVDIMLYDLTGRNNSRNTSQYRFDKNEKADADLMKIKKGFIELDIPTRVFDTEEEEEESLGQIVNFGSMNVRTRHDY